jgi:hypothetical protein
MAMHGAMVSIGTGDVAKSALRTVVLPTNRENRGAAMAASQGCEGSNLVTLLIRSRA